jgi:hypothetical protein
MYDSTTLTLYTPHDTYLFLNNSQLEREGQAPQEHRYRPYALPEDRRPQVPERIPNGRAQGLPWPLDCLNYTVNESSYSFYVSIQSMELGIMDI